jgi:predicted aldo/keto reductase-like oxidoreductase
MKTMPNHASDRQINCSVYFTAKPRGFYSVEVASKQMMKDFNIPPEKMRDLLARAKKAPVLLKAHIPYDEAKALAKKIEVCGFVCSPTMDEINLDEGANIYDQVEEAAKQVKAKTVEYWKLCPQCFKKQDADNAQCEDCGYALQK